MCAVCINPVSDCVLTCGHFMCRVCATDIIAHAFNKMADDEVEVHDVGSDDDDVELVPHVVDRAVGDFAHLFVFADGAADDADRDPDRDPPRPRRIVAANGEDLGPGVPVDDQIHAKCPTCRKDFTMADVRTVWLGADI